jgi:hypothetical protein
MKWHAPHKKRKKKKYKCNKEKNMKLARLFGKGCCIFKRDRNKKGTDLFDLFSPVDVSKCKPLESGDELFKEPSDYEDLLIINRFGKQSDFLIIEGYKNIVSNSLRQLQKEKGNLSKDSHVYPILFLFRHYLELIMKQTLRNFRLTNKEIASDEVGYERGHSLTDLWSEVKAYISKLENEDVDDEGYLIFEELINELTEIDDNSFSFRYPYKGVRNVNNKITLCIPDPMDVSLDNLEEIIHKMFCFIEGLNDLSYAQLDKK